MPDYLHVVGLEYFPFRFKHLRSSAFEQAPGKGNRIFRVTAYSVMNPKAKSDSDRAFKPESTVWHPPRIRGAPGSAREQYRQLASLKTFLAQKAVPLLRKHGAIYLKDAEGGGGKNIARLSVKMGKIILETTNENLQLQLQLYRKILSANTEKKARNSGPDGIEIRLRKDANARTAIDRTDQLDPSRLNRFASALLEHFIPKDQPRPLLVAEQEIPHLKAEVDGALFPLEFRFILQRHADGTYKTVHHYAKVGANRFTANISQGGFRSDSLKELNYALAREYPALSKVERGRFARQFIQQATQDAQRRIKNTAEYHQPTTVRPGQEAKEYDVQSPPLLVSVDYLALPQPDGRPVPTFMEQHERAYGIYGSSEDGLLSKKKFLKIVRTLRWTLRHLHEDWLRKLSQSASTNKGAVPG